MCPRATPDAVADAVGAVLRDPACRDAAVAVQAASERLEGAAALDLEQLTPSEL